MLSNIVSSYTHALLLMYGFQALTGKKLNYVLLSVSLYNHMHLGPLMS